MHNHANLITDHTDGIDLECGEWSLINALRPAVLVDLLGGGSITRHGPDPGDLCVDGHGCQRSVVPMTARVPGTCLCVSLHIRVLCISP
jgi:hypothetical protein